MEQKDLTTILETREGGWIDKKLLFKFVGLFGIKPKIPWKRISDSFTLSQIAQILVDNNLRGNMDEAIVATETLLSKKMKYDPGLEYDERWYVFSQLEDSRPVKYRLEYFSELAGGVV